MCFQEVVEEPATDGDSDHTDSEGSVNTKNTCKLVVLFFNTTCSMGMSLGTRLSNILMYIPNISCLHVDGVYWYVCTLLNALFP